MGTLPKYVKYIYLAYGCIVWHSTVYLCFSVSRDVHMRLVLWQNTSACLRSGLCLITRN